MSATITLFTPAQAETVWVVRDRIRFMGEVPGTDLAIVEVEVPPGSGTPPHRHASPEVFRVLTGEMTFGLFEPGPPREVSAGAGAVVTVPPNVPHNYRNAGSVTATMLVVVDRSMAAFFRDLGRQEVPAGGPPAEAEIAAVLAACARHGITLLPGAPR
ncbi:MAG TPA: cupin domain-containing protein [Lacunisphaera sp.]